MFEEELATLHHVEEECPSLNSHFTRLTPDSLEAIKSEFPTLPADYICFLSEIGYGSAYAGGLTFSLGPTWFDADFAPCEVNGASRTQMLLFGGDIGGDLWGFLADEGYCVFEWDHEVGDLSRFAGSFRDFVRYKFRVGDNAWWELQS